MVDIIMLVPIRCVIFVFSAILYVFVVACVLPRMLLKPAYNLSDMGSRGLKKYVFDGGRAITYQPSPAAKKYIKQYILSSNNGQKYIKCKLDERVFSIKYDVVALDSNDKVIDVVSISEPIITAGMGRCALLPNNTSYVCIIVKEINESFVKDSPKMIYHTAKVGIFAALTVALTVIEALVLRSIAVNIADTFVNYSEITGNGGGLTMTLVALLVGLVLAGVILLSYYSRDTRITFFKKL